MPKPYLDCLILVLLPTIVNLSSAGSFSIPRTIVSLLFFGLLLKNVFVYSAISSMWQKKVDSAFSLVFSLKNKEFFLLLALIALFTIAEIRGGYLGVVSAFGFFGFFLWSLSILFYLASVSVLNPSEQSRRMLVVSIVIGMGFYIALNLLAVAFGLRGPLILENVGQNKMLSVIGLSYSRIAFPLAGGLNNAGVMAGLTFISGVAMARNPEGLMLRLVGLIVAFLGLAGVILVDSRAALATALLVGLLLPVVVASKFLSRRLYLLPIIALAAPVLILGAYYLYRDSELASFLMREGNFAQRLGALSGRDVVWSSAFDILAKPIPIQVIGYGALGQYTSGASAGYAWVFLESRGFSAHSLHNAILQVIFDTGYIGAIVWMTFWIFLTTSLGKLLAAGRRGLEVTFPSGVVIYLMVAGIFEICGTPAFPDSFAMTIFVVAWLLPVPTRGKVKDEVITGGRDRAVSIG